METLVMPEPIILTAPVLAQFRKLALITNDDEAALLGALSIRRRMAAKSEIYHASEHASSVCIIQQGYAYRFMDLPDGRRQITELLLPGDICDLGGVPTQSADHGFFALTTLIYSEIKRQSLAALVNCHPCLGAALARAAVLKRTMLYERIISLGQRSAKERLGHLFCEVFVRSRAVGLTSGMQCRLPMNQGDLADMLGLSLVHVNRSVMALRTEGLIRLNSHLLTIVDSKRLQEAANFNPKYLQIDCGNAKRACAPERLILVA